VQISKTNTRSTKVQKSAQPKTRFLLVSDKTKMRKARYGNFSRAVQHNDRNVGRRSLLPRNGDESYMQQYA
jgi:hypothetical protein